MKKLLALIVVLVIGAAVGGFFYLRGDSPEEVSLSTSRPTDAATGTFDGDFNGEWTVAKSTGDPRDESFTGTYAGYRIVEELGGVGTNTAVGRTTDVTGSMTITDTTISAVDVEVDLATLASDRDMRDNAVRTRALETEQADNRIATFELTEPIDVGSEPEANEKVERTATGEFTLHGVTKEVQIPIEARFTGEQIEVVSSFDVLLADYNIEKPIVGRVRSIEDSGKVEMRLLFEKA